MNYADEFRQYETEECRRDVEETNAVWFKDADGCYPVGYLGEDLLNDIMTKFYEPLSFVRELLEDEMKRSPLHIRIAVMPSYEDHTFYVVTYDGRVVLEQNGEKAWNFFFERDQDFNKWVEETLERWRRKI